MSSVSDEAVALETFGVGIDGAAVELASLMVGDSGAEIEAERLSVAQQHEEAFEFSEVEQQNAFGCVPVQHEAVASIVVFGVVVAEVLGEAAVFVDAVFVVVVVFVACVERVVFRFVTLSDFDPPQSHADF